MIEHIVVGGLVLADMALSAYVAYLLRGIGVTARRIRADHAAEVAAQIQINDASADAIQAVQMQVDRLAEYTGTIDARTRPASPHTRPETPSSRASEALLRPHGDAPESFTPPILLKDW